MIEDPRKKVEKLKEEMEFLQWYKNLPQVQSGNLNPNPYDPRHFYDYRGFWNKYRGTRSGMSINTKDGLWHFTDEFKTPYHPTFSNESIYNDSSKGIIGGTWNEEDFTPSPWNRKVELMKKISEFIK